MRSQEAQILEHLQSGKTLTPIQALNLFGSFRLGARCFNLKKAGYHIMNKMIKVSKNKRVAQYSLENVDQNGQYKMEL